MFFTAKEKTINRIHTHFSLIVLTVLIFVTKTEKHKEKYSWMIWYLFGNTNYSISGKYSSSESSSVDSDSRLNVHTLNVFTLNKFLLNFPYSFKFLQPIGWSDHFKLLIGQTFNTVQLKCDIVSCYPVFTPA